MLPNMIKPPKPPIMRHIAGLVVLAKAPYDSIIGTLYSSLFFLISGEKINDILFMITDFLGSIS